MHPHAIQLLVTSDPQLTSLHSSRQIHRLAQDTTGARKLIDHLD
jgi:hypothetical protein